jgi:hypothetical protein
MPRLALIHFLDRPTPVDPGYGVEAPSARPDHELPTPPVRPDQSLPIPPVRPDNSLPNAPVYPIQIPVFPVDITNPIALPPAENKPIDPDQKFELKWSVAYGWVLVPCNDESAKPKR